MLEQVTVPRAAPAHTASNRPPRPLRSRLPQNALLARRLIVLAFRAGTRGGGTSCVSV